MRAQTIGRLLVPVVALAVGAAAAACDRSASPSSPSAASSGPAAAGAPAAIDIGGTWTFSEETRLTLPGELLLDLGAQWEGPVIHVTCASPDGALEIVQTASTFTGTLEYQTGTCLTTGGQAVPPPWPLPYRAVLTGRIAGLSLHIEQWDDPPGPSPDGVRCPKNGTVSIDGGVATALQTAGRCDLSSLPFQPAVATNRGAAVR
jgi:hypothetical protein